MTAPLILASASSYRQRLLQRLGLPFIAVEHLADETETAGLSLEAIPTELAARKAESLRTAHPTAFILGSDQVVVASGQVLGKPGDLTGAREQLRLLRNATHELITGVALIEPDGVEHRRTVTTHMTLRELSDDEIDRYLEIDRPFDCCGSYKIEALGISLVKSIDGPDFTAIEGLPLIAVSELLRDVGFKIP